MYLVLATLEITAADYNPQSGDFDGSPFDIPDWVRNSAQAMSFIDSVFKNPQHCLTPHTTGGSDYAQWCLNGDTANSVGPGDYIDVLVNGGVMLRKAGTMDKEAYQLTEIYAKAFPKADSFTFDRLRANAALLHYALSVVIHNKGNVIDTLHAFVTRGQLFVGDVPSKVGLSELVEVAYVTTEDASTYTATPEGHTVYSAIHNLIKEYGKHAQRK